jgi:tetratricopeptide (TPR) repeat protein
MGMRHSVHSIFFEQADAHEAAGRWDQALALLYQAQRWAHPDAAYWVRLGLVSLRLAEPAWLQAAGLDASHVGDMAALNAELYLERASRLAPSDAAPPFWQAWAMHHTGREPAAVREALHEALTRDARWPYALALLGRLELAERSPGFPPRARRALEGACEALPESPRLQYDLGAARAADGDVRGACEALGRAMTLPPLPGPPGTAGGWLAEAFHGQPAVLRGWVETYFADLFEASGLALPARRP